MALCPWLPGKKHSPTHTHQEEGFTCKYSELRSISIPFRPFRALMKVLPLSELYFRATDLDLVHSVFLQKAFLAVYVRYGDNTGQNKAKKERHGGSRGQTGSRNMAETSFSDSATPTSYSTSYTLWGLSRTITAPPAENFNISPL